MHKGDQSECIDDSAAQTNAAKERKFHRVIEDSKCYLIGW